MAVWPVNLYKTNFKIYIYNININTLSVHISCENCLQGYIYTSGVHCYIIIIVLWGLFNYI